MPFLPNATARIFNLSDLTNPVWTGHTDTSGRVVDASAQLPSLGYGDYRVVIDHCDYDTEILNFNIPRDNLLTMTTGCTSSITTHETVYDHSKLNQGLTLPPGIGPLPYLGTTPPIGWLLCDGSAISRTVYAGLFAIINIKFGTGDGISTFNLPDMRGRIPVGAGASGVFSIGDVGGEQNHTLTISEMPTHTHNVEAHKNYGTTMAASSGGWEVIVTNSGPAGGNASHNNMQPYLGVNYIISI